MRSTPFVASMTALILCWSMARSAEPPVAPAALEVRVAVAANFAQTLQRVWDAFSAKHGGRLIMSSGSTGQLYSQIVQGAPFDIFLAADVERPLQLERQGLTVPDSRFTYAMGQLVAWRPRQPWQGDLRDVLRSREIQIVAIANPQTAPYGYAAQEVLQALGPEWAFTLVRGESLGQTFQFAANGHAQLAFIALSQIYESQPDAGRSLRSEIHRVDPSLYRPLEQQAVLLKRPKPSALAAKFLAFLRSAEGKSLIEAAGYLAPAAP